MNSSRAAVCTINRTGRRRRDPCWTRAAPCCKRSAAIWQGSPAWRSISCGIGDFRRRCVPQRTGIGVGSAVQEQRSFDRLAVDCDRTLIIAPESDGWLLSRCQRAVRIGATLIGPLPELVALASDKCATADWLRRAGLPVPATHRCRSASDLPPELDWPAIVKPVDGAGSLDVRRIGLAEARQVIERVANLLRPGILPGSAGKCCRDLRSRPANSSATLLAASGRVFVRLSGRIIDPRHDIGGPGRAIGSSAPCGVFPLRWVTSDWI